MLSKKKIYFILFIPFILNLSISFAISSYIYMKGIEAGLSYEEISFEIIKAIYTYNFYWSFIQIIIGVYAIKLMGGFAKFKEALKLEEMKNNLKGSLSVIVGLAIFSLIIIWSFQFLTAISYGNIEAYFEEWRSIVAILPIYTKIYMVLIAPFTAGIFEEAIWRWFGIEKLEDYYSSSKANVIQAIAFGLWHGISFHTIATAIIGFTFGLAYVKRRRLGELIAAHIVTDIIGFGVAFLL
ncbi:MAG: CPBP family intramembrane glutamic endopeptidase [Candidatus Asgardarchaeia archaeon]